jgi:membrane glycosyltransferase
VGVGAALRSALAGRGGGERAQRRPPERDCAPWAKAAARRRATLLAVIGTATTAAVGVLVAGDGAPPDAIALLHAALFAVLFAWVTAGFVTAAMGALVLWRGDSQGLTAGRAPIAPEARTAIVMPICNEDIATVFGGLHATCASLAATGASRLFDVFVLSDTSDPALRAAELRAWRTLREELGDNARVYYRWRRRRTKRKAGNVADFCRRWGANYRYMVVLDADSVMSGDCLVSLVRLMEAHPKAGIVQALPQACGHATLHARAQQFLGRIAGRLFAAGMSYWQLGESHYWGHNAILRVQPFMRHCALAPIPGRGGLSGEILSHDFVEAALMRRAGYEVWLVDVPGSYEQQPPHLVDELQRDRRWCQGNLQNARLIAEPGFARVHRAMLACGAMSYLASPLWLAFVVVGVARGLFGDGAPALPAAAIALWSATLAMLLLPRVLGVISVVQRGEQAAFGGGARLAAGALLEGLLSVLQAPLRMLAHTMFVVGALTGLRIEWKSPSRDAVSVGWGEALARFGVVGALVVMGLAIAAARDELSAALVLAPLALPLALAAPLVVLTSRVGAGAWLRRRKLLLIPEEVRVPALLQAVWLPAPRPLPARATRAPRIGPWLAGTGQRLVSACHAATPHALAVARAIGVAAVIGVPVVSSPGAGSPRIAFSYVAAAPAPWLETRVLAQAPVERVTAGGDSSLRSVAAGKRRPKRPTASSI